jgi:hypothetical protein
LGPDQTDQFRLLHPAQEFLDSLPLELHLRSYQLIDHGRGDHGRRRRRGVPEFDGGRPGAEVHEALAAADMATPSPEKAAMAEVKGPVLSAMGAMEVMAHELHVRPVVMGDGGGMQEG